MQPQYSQNEDYQTESSRGSDLSDIMEEDEEELYSEMQLEEGRRRNSHCTQKVPTHVQHSSSFSPSSIRLFSHRVWIWYTYSMDCILHVFCVLEDVM